MARGSPIPGDPARVLPVVFGCRAEDVAETVIVSPFIPIRAFRREAQGDTVELTPPFFYKGFTGRKGSLRFTVIHTGVGPSRLGDCLGFLSLTPARRILFAGAVGGLDPRYAIGETFLPTEVADGEGFSRYARQPFGELARTAPLSSCRTRLGNELGAFLRSSGSVVRCGRVFTVGAITSESRANLEVLAALRFQALEMELSAFYAASGRWGFEAAALTYVSDLPLRSDLWSEKAPGEEEALRSAYRALPGLALEFLSRGA